MPVEILSNEYMFALLGPKKTFGQWNRPQLVVDYLFDALEVIRARFRNPTISTDDKRRPSYIIDISRTCQSSCPETQRYSEHLAAWKTLAGYRSLHGRLKEWIEQLEVLIAENAPERYQDGIYEIGDSQLGEVALRALALTDKSFVPFFVRMLRVWNCVPAERGTYLQLVIEEIVREYGLCPETEELIECAYSEWGYEGYELSHLLKQLHNDLPNYPLFRRIVASQSEWFANCRPKEWSVILDRLRADPHAPVAGRAEERWVFRDDAYSGIWEDADIVLAELDAVAITNS